MTTDQAVLILGGGVGGVVAANRLRKQLPKRQRVVLIDRESEQLFAPSLLWLMTGGREAARISRPLDRLGRKGIEVVRGEIERIDPEERSVIVNGRALTGDQLVIALGAELAPETVPGLAEAGHDFYTLRGAEGLRGALASFRSGRIVVLTATPAYKCPAAPYEAAMLIEYDCRKRKVRDDVHIDLYAAEPGPMGVAGADVSAGVRQMVERKGVVYHPEHQVTEVDPVARRLVFANGASAGFDLLAFVPPHRAPRPVRDAGLVDDSGWIPVDRGTLETRFPRVYAIGDVTSVPLTMGKPLPMAGVFAHARSGYRRRRQRRARHHGQGRDEGVRRSRRVLHRDRRRQGRLRPRGLLRRAGACHPHAPARAPLALGQGAVREGLAATLVLFA